MVLFSRKGEMPCFQSGNGWAAVAMRTVKRELQWLRSAGSRVMSSAGLWVLWVRTSYESSSISGSSASCWVLRMMEFFGCWGLYGVFFNGRVSEWLRWEESRIVILLRCAVIWEDNLSFQVWIISNVVYEGNRSLCDDSFVTTDFGVCSNIFDKCRISAASVFCVLFCGFQ